MASTSSHELSYGVDIAITKYSGSQILLPDLNRLSILMVFIHKTQFQVLTTYFPDLDHSPPRLGTVYPRTRPVQSRSRRCVHC